MTTDPIGTMVRLSELIQRKNDIDNMISEIIGRPSLIGHTGEYIAAQVFEIKLNQSAVYKGFDGRFKQPPLSGKTVNIKWYGKHEGILDINPEGTPDYYLVLTGPKVPAASSRGTVRPWVIEKVFLFEGDLLAGELRKRGVKIGIATSVFKQLWDKAEIYPESHNKELALTDEQFKMLALFKGK